MIVLLLHLLLELLFFFLSAPHGRCALKTFLSLAREDPILLKELLNISAVSMPIQFYNVPTLWVYVSRRDRGVPAQPVVRTFVCEKIFVDAEILLEGVGDPCSMYDICLVDGLMCSGMSFGCSAVSQGEICNAVWWDRRPRGRRWQNLISRKNTKSMNVSCE